MIFFSPSFLFNWSSGIRGESSVRSCAALIGWRFHQNTIGKSREFIQFRSRSLLINPLITETRAGQASPRDSPEASSETRRASLRDLCAHLHTDAQRRATSPSASLLREPSRSTHLIGEHHRTRVSVSHSERSHRIGLLLSTKTPSDMWMRVGIQSFTSV